MIRTPFSFLPSEERQSFFPNIRLDSAIPPSFLHGEHGVPCVSLISPLPTEISPRPSFSRKMR